MVQAHCCQCQLPKMLTGRKTQFPNRHMMQRYLKCTLWSVVFIWILCCRTSASLKSSQTLTSKVTKCIENNHLLDVLYYKIKDMIITRYDTNASSVYHHLLRVGSVTFDISYFACDHWRQPSGDIVFYINKFHGSNNELQTLRNKIH